jgi:hypothetical protein
VSNYKSHFYPSQTQLVQLREILRREQRLVLLVVRLLEPWVALERVEEHVVDSK